MLDNRTYAQKRLTEGASCRDIAKELGLHHSTVARWFQTGEALPDPKVDALKARIGNLESALKKAQKASGSLELLFDNIRDAAFRIEPPAKFVKPKVRRSTNEIAVGFKVSDWHIGEHYEADRIEGFGEFSWDIAIARLDQATSTLVKWVEAQRNAYTINDLHILSEGDLIGGMLHMDQLLSVEFPVPEQIVRAGQAFTRVLERLAPHFRHITVNAVNAYNHGRLFKKPLAYNKDGWSLTRTVHAYAQVATGDLATWNHAKGPTMIVDIAGHRFLSEHGDNVKTWMGIPWMGLYRKQGQEAMRRMLSKRTATHFDYHSVGHWHVPGFHGITLMNGSLCGTTGYDHGSGRSAPPSQVAFMVHPTHGIFNFIPLWLD